MEKIMKAQRLLGRGIVALFLTFALFGGLSFARGGAQKAEPPRYEMREDHDPDGIGKFYMGREIAHVMGHQAADWLDRPEREEEEQPAKLIELMALRPGDVV